MSCNIKLGSRRDLPRAAAVACVFWRSGSLARARPGTAFAVASMSWRIRVVVIWVSAGPSRALGGGVCARVNATHDTTRQGMVSGAGIPRMDLFSTRDRLSARWFFHFESDRTDGKLQADL